MIAILSLLPHYPYQAPKYHYHLDGIFCDPVPVGWWSFSPFTRPTERQNDNKISRDGRILTFATKLLWSASLSESFNMAGSTKQERDSHIPRLEVPEATATNVQMKRSGQNHSHPIVSHRQCSQEPILSHSHPSHPEAASLVINNVCTPGVYPMTVGEMGNVVMQSAGDSTDQYVVLIGNVSQINYSSSAR